MDRVQKIISNLGYCSRRKAEELIELKKVKVNGKISNLGDKAKITDKIEIDGKEISSNGEKFYYVLNKPKGVLVTKDDPQNRETIYDLDSLKNLKKKINQKLNYIGRLDGMSEGLLILTNDGNFNNKLAHPSNHVEKTYLVRTSPILKKEDVEKIENGILVEKRKFFAKISGIKNNEFLITISEGRNRIIRKVMEKLGYKIFQLKRISIGNLKLEGLQEGMVRKLKKNELNSFK